MGIRRKAAVAGAATIALAGVGFGGIADGHGGHKVPWISVQDTWILQSLPEHDHAIGPDGQTLPDEEDFIPAAGSQFFFTENVWTSTPDGKPGERIGTDFGECTVTNTAGLCTVHVDIHDRGTISVAFGFDFDGLDTANPDGVSAQGHELPEEVPPEPVAIVGGTGEFKGIQGEAVLHHADDPESELTRLEIDAVIPHHVHEH